MVLTLASLVSDVRQQLGRDPSLTSAEALVNEAGEAWVDSHSWKYLTDRTTTIDLVPGQVLYRMPDGIESVGTRIERANSIWHPIKVLSYDDFHAERFRYLSEVGREFTPIATFRYTQQPGDDSPKPYIEIWPDGITETVQVMYRAGWLPMNESDDAVDLPPQLESSFKEFVRRYALGRETASDVADGIWLDQMISSFFAGPRGVAAKTKDGLAGGMPQGVLTRSQLRYGRSKARQRGFTSGRGDFYDAYRWYTAPRR